MPAQHTPARLEIDFVSDVVCPWCAIGLASLEQALQRLGGEVEVALRFRPFELNPQMVPEGEPIGEHLARKYGLAPAQLERNREAIRARGAALGFGFGPRDRIWNTFDAHRLLHWAALEGRQPALKRALLQAYHGRGENVASHEVLVRAAAEAGLDAGRAREVLDGDLYAREVRADERAWLDAGIRAVPAVVVDGRHLIEGGQPPEVFEQSLRQLAQAKSSAAEGGAAAG